MRGGRSIRHAARRAAGRLAEAPAPRPRADVLAEAGAAGLRVVDLGAAPLPLAAAAARAAAAAGPDARESAVLYGRASAAEEKLAARRDAAP